MWPWRHGRRARPDPPPLAEQTQPRGEWRGVAPIQRTIAAHPLVNPAEVFRASLETWQDPRFLSPLGHTVSCGEPSGLIDVSTPPTPGSTALSRSWSAPTGVVQRATDPDNAAGDAPPRAGAALPLEVAAHVQRSADADDPPRQVATSAIDPPPEPQPTRASNADAASALPTLSSGSHAPTLGVGAQAVQRTPAVAPSAAAPRRLGLGTPIQPDAASVAVPPAPPAAASLPAGASFAGPLSGVPLLPDAFAEAPPAVAVNERTDDAQPAGPASTSSGPTGPAGLDLVSEGTPSGAGDLPVVRLPSPVGAVLPLRSSSAAPPLPVARLVGDRPPLATSLTTGAGGVPPGRGLASTLHRPAGYSRALSSGEQVSTMDNQAGWRASVQQTRATPAGVTTTVASHRGTPLPAARHPELVTVQPMTADAVAAPPGPPPAATAANVPALPDPIAVTVQRQVEPGAATAPTAGAAAAPAAGGEPEELLGRLYDPLLRRLKAELRLDRDRRGSLTDLRL